MRRHLVDALDARGDSGISRQPAGFLDQSLTALHPLGSKIFGYSNVTPRRRSVENCQRDPPPERRFMHPAESSGIQIPPVSCGEQAKHCASFLRCTWRLMAHCHRRPVGHCQQHLRSRTMRFCNFASVLAYPRFNGERRRNFHAIALNRCMRTDTAGTSSIMAAVFLASLACACAATTSPSPCSARDRKY